MITDDLEQKGRNDFVSKENILLYVGRMSKEKNISLAIDAWKLIHKRLPNWKFVIVGDGPLRENLEKRAVGIGNIEFAGTCTDPTPYYRKAGILLL